MNTIKLYSVLFFSLTMSVAGCKKDDEGGGGGEEAAGKGAETKDDAPVETERRTLDELGVSIEIPKDAHVADTSADAPNASISGSACSLNVNTVTIAYPDSFAKAKESIQKDPNPFQKFTREEEIEGGWHLEYELKSMLDETPLYGVQIRKTIGDKQFQCGRNVRDASKVDCVAKACLTLQPAAGAGTR